MLGGATASADCVGARHALSWRDAGPARLSLEETAASERHVAARSGVEAARLRLEREARRAGNARRDHAEARGVCRFLDDDSDPVPGLRGDNGPAADARWLGGRRRRDRGAVA